jgi:glyoxylase-like metal-dependent hydrolase (beta-lactamase superfamily II)
MPDANPPRIETFFDEATNTATHLVVDPATRACAVVDPVLDWDNRSGEADTRSVRAVLDRIAAEGLTLAWILETHVHADHLTAAPWLRARSGAPVGIGAHVREVQTIFRPVFGLDDLAPQGGDFDRLFEDGERFAIGSLAVEVLHVPGHTPADVAYRVDGRGGPDCVFVSDTMFMPDYGTARCDFPGGDARALYRSIRRLLDLPPETRLFMCHDYKAPGRDAFAWETTVAAQRAGNRHIRDGVTEEEFVAFRTARDATLSAPVLLLPSLQVNLRAGRFPPAEANGVRYLRIPVTAKAPEALA